MKFSISDRLMSLDLRISIPIHKHPKEHGCDKTLDVIETHGAPTCGTADLRISIPIHKPKRTCR